AWAHKGSRFSNSSHRESYQIRHTWTSAGGSSPTIGRGVLESSRRSRWVPVEERTHKRDDLLRLVLEHVVPCAGKSVDLRLGEAADPLLEEVAVEDEILESPGDHHRHAGERAEAVLDLGHQVVAAVTGAERDVLDEPVDGDAVRPGVVGGDI